MEETEGAFPFIWGTLQKTGIPCNFRMIEGGRIDAVVGQRQEGFAIRMNHHGNGAVLHQDHIGKLGQIARACDRRNFCADVSQRHHGRFQFHVAQGCALKHCSAGFKQFVIGRPAPDGQLQRLCLSGICNADTGKHQAKRHQH